MRTHLSLVLHSGNFRAPGKYPVSDCLQNNSYALPGGGTLSFEEDLAFRFINIIKFCVQRFCVCLNLGTLILSLPFLMKFSLTINNYLAIKIC